MAKQAKKATSPQKHKAKTKSGKKIPVKSTKRKAAAKAAKKKTHKKPLGTCFVLMPFKEPFDTYYTMIIKPAVIAARLEPLRGDSLFRPSPIMGDIWEMIQNAKVLVAELTEKNANVFYELGLGHAIGKPIVLMSETIDDVPFDLQPLRVIIYDKDDPAWGAKLRTNLIASLGETVSDPTNAVPNMFRKKVKSQAPEEAATSARLSVLEREIGALRGDEGLRFGSSRSLRPIFQPPQFKRALIAASSREDAAQITKRALLGGIPESSIRRILKQTVPAGEAEEVLALAWGSREGSLS